MMPRKKQAHKRGISLLLLIPILLFFIGFLLIKVFDLTGNIITPPCGGGSLLAKFNVYGSKTSDPDANDGFLNDVQVRLQPANKDCMYSGKTNKNGYLELTRIIPGAYKLTVKQKDINRGKTLCDVFKDTVDIKENVEYTIALTNCNNHAFNI